MKKAALGARLLLGLVMLVFGLNGFLGFLPMPEMPAEAGKFMGALIETGYLFYLLKVTEIVAGVALLAGMFVPLALVILAPVMINIVLFHLFLAMDGIGLSIVLLALHLYLAWENRDAYATLLKAK